MQGMHNDTWWEGGAEYIRVLTQFLKETCDYTPTHKSSFPAAAAAANIAASFGASYAVPDSNDPNSVSSSSSLPTTAAGLPTETVSAQAQGQTQTQTAADGVDEGKDGECDDVGLRQRFNTNN